MQDFPLKLLDARKVGADLTVAFVVRHTQFYEYFSVFEEQISLQLLIRGRREAPSEELDEIERQARHPCDDCSLPHKVHRFYEFCI